MAPLRDPYELLGLDRSADPRDVKRAYRRLAKRFHPDATRDDGRRFVALRLAYETLSDLDRRAEWDRRHPGSGRRRAADATTGRSPRRSRSAGEGRSGGRREAASQAATIGARPRDPLGRFVRADAVPWWEEIRGGHAVGADVPGSRGDPHLGPSSGGAAWSSAARAYHRRLTRQDGATARSAATADRPKRKG